MKKIVLLLLAALCGVSTVAAQDLIVKTDASKVEAKVTEISPEVVRYKRFSNPDGPTYVLPVGDISYIQYANGEKEVFRTPEAQPAAASTVPSITAVPATPAAPVTATTPVATTQTAPTPAPQPAPSSVEYVAKRYQVGDLYDRDGVKGVVCKVTDEGTHGLIISHTEIYHPWSTFRKPDLRTVGADDRMDGQANMQKVAEYIAANGLTWDDFPAFKWCREQGEGWYLPSIDELLLIGHNYNGGTRISNNRQARNKFNEALKNNGGKRMDRLVYYFSSTEKDEKEAFTTHTGIEPPYVIDIPKSNKFLVRAVRKF